MFCRVGVGGDEGVFCVADCQVIRELEDVGICCVRMVQRYDLFVINVCFFCVVGWGLGGVGGVVEIKKI